MLPPYLVVMRTCIERCMFGGSDCNRYARCIPTVHGSLLAERIIGNGVTGLNLCAMLMRRLDMTFGTATFALTSRE